MDKSRLGNEIKKWRKKRGLTQRDLSQNVCHQSEISRIENGEVFPSIDLLYVFSSKLKVPVSYFLKVLVYDDFTYKNTIVDTLFELSKQKKYKEILNYIDRKQDHHHHSEYYEFHKILSWHYWLASYRLGRIDDQTCTTELNLLLRNTTPSAIVLHLDLYIKNSIANVYAEHNKINESIRLYKEIIHYESLEKNFLCLKIKALYNFSKLLFQKNEYDSSIRHIEHALKLSIHLNNMTLLGQLYYQRAECMEKMGYSENEIAGYYRKAYFFFDLLHLDFYKQVSFKKKHRYLKR
ncbi:helix-turn-helix domain-containing protein [Sporolactobacillus kofuensis]|uniref:Helix-turn-helix domain-containing protein n=1 Tax=Sporolactobacillus kofuensis TaxID=269672 RepID=A0ABW1WFU5_9BACL|nr:helix-turn-helix domain-containing protein [Sporolactobacillus kofuensis]MCO7175748.1 helix-turn-helix transcriptional regulator [Sporolactobacillus kofuensis]